MANKTYKWLVFFTTGLLLLLMNIDMTAVNLALAPIANDLNLSIINVQWIISAYLIGGASMVMLGGLLGDYYGHKKIFIYGALLFTLASAGVGFSSNQWVLITMRLLQGFGAALAWPLAIVIVRETFVGQEGLAMGLIAAVMAISMSIGPPVGGLILHFLNWRWIFLINIPLGLLVIIMALVYLPKDKASHHDEKLHIKSAIILVIALLSLTFALNEGQPLGFDSPLIITTFISGIVLLTLFIMMQKKISHPLIDLNLFKDKGLAGCFGVRFCWQVIWIGLFLIMSLFFQNIAGFSALHTSYYFLSLTLSYAAISPFGGLLIEKFSARSLIVAGISLSLIPLLMLTTINTQTSALQLVLIFSLYGVSAAIVFPSLLNGTLALAPLERRGMVSGILYMMLFAGGSLGAIAVGAVLNHAAPSYLWQKVKMLGLSIDPALHLKLSELATGVRDIHKVQNYFSLDQAKVIINLLEQSFLHAMTLLMIAAVFISLLMIVFAHFIRRGSN